MKNIKNIVQHYAKHRFLYNLGFLSALFFVHCFWGDMMYVAFPILAIMTLADNLQNGFSYIIFSIPFCFLNVYISAILMLCCGAAYIIKYYSIKFFKEKSKPSWLPFAFICIFLIYCLMPTGEYNLNTLIRFMLFSSLFIALCAVSKNPETFRGHFNVKLLGISIIISSVFSLTYFFSPYLKEYLIIYHAGEIPRFMALFYNTNVLGMFCSVLLSFIAFFILSKKASLSDYLIFAALAGIGILTFSKTFIFILLLILAVLLIWRLCCDFKKTFFITLGIACVAVAVCLIFPQIIKPIIEVFVRELQKCNNFTDFMNMVTTDRFQLWVEYATFIAQNPLVLFFGRGLGAPVLSTLSPHNAYISMIYELGIVGTALLITAITLVLIDTFKGKQKKIHWSIFLPALVFGLIFIFEDLIFFIFE